MSRRGVILTAIMQREIQSLLAGAAGWAVTLGAAAAVLVMAALSAPDGYQATAVDLVVLLELLMPAVGVALGYRAVLDDRLSGEWAIHRAIGVDPRTYVVGIYLGQVTVFGLVIGGSLTLATAVVAVRRTRPIDFLASTPAVADPAAMLWLIGLSVAYALVIMAIVMLLSVWMRTRREAILGAAVVVGLVVIGMDAVAIATSAPLPLVTGLSPGAAYRALVLTMGVGLSTEGPVFAAVVGWVIWTLGALTVSIRRLRAAS